MATEDVLSGISLAGHEIELALLLPLSLDWELLDSEVLNSLSSPNELESEPKTKEFAICTLENLAILEQQFVFIFSINLELLYN